jgi:hypothetical protein
MTMKIQAAMMRGEAGKAEAATAGESHKQFIVTVVGES